MGDPRRGQSTADIERSERFTTAFRDFEKLQTEIGNFINETDLPKSFRPLFHSMDKVLKRTTLNAAEKTKIPTLSQEIYTRIQEIILLLRSWYNLQLAAAPKTDTIILKQIQDISALFNRAADELKDNRNDEVNYHYVQLIRKQIDELAHEIAPVSTDHFGNPEASYADLHLTPELFHALTEIHNQDTLPPTDTIDTTSVDDSDLDAFDAFNEPTPLPETPDTQEIPVVIPASQETLTLHDTGDFGVDALTALATERRETEKKQFSMTADDEHHQFLLTQTKDGQEKTTPLPYPQQFHGKIISNDQFSIIFTLTEKETGEIYSYTLYQKPITQEKTKTNQSPESVWLEISHEENGKTTTETRRYRNNMDIPRYFKTHFELLDQKEQEPIQREVTIEKRGTHIILKEKDGQETTISIPEPFEITFIEQGPDKFILNIQEKNRVDDKFILFEYTPGSLKFFMYKKGKLVNEHTRTAAANPVKAIQNSLESIFHNAKTKKTRPRRSALDILANESLELPQQEPETTEESIQRLILSIFSKLKNKSSPIGDKLRTLIESQLIQINDQNADPDRSKKIHFWLDTKQSRPYYRHDHPDYEPGGEIPNQQTITTLLEAVNTLSQQVSGAPENYEQKMIRIEDLRQNPKTIPQAFKKAQSLLSEFLDALELGGFPALHATPETQPPQPVSPEAEMSDNEDPAFDSFEGEVPIGADSRLQTETEPALWPSVNVDFDEASGRILIHDLIEGSSKLINGFNGFVGYTLKTESNDAVLEISFSNGTNTLDLTLFTPQSGEVGGRVLRYIKIDDKEYNEPTERFGMPGIIEGFEEFRRLVPMVVFATPEQRERERAEQELRMIGFRVNKLIEGEQPKINAKISQLKRFHETLPNNIQETLKDILTFGATGDLQNLQKAISKAHTLLDAALEKEKATIITVTPTPPKKSFWKKTSTWVGGAVLAGFGALASIFIPAMRKQEDDPSKLPPAVIKIDIKADDTVINSQQPEMAKTVKADVANIVPDLPVVDAGTPVDAETTVVAQVQAPATTFDLGLPQEQFSPDAWREGIEKVGSALGAGLIKPVETAAAHVIRDTADQVRALQDFIDNFKPAERESKTPISVSIPIDHHGWGLSHFMKQYFEQQRENKQNQQADKWQLSDSQINKTILNALNHKPDLLRKGSYIHIGDVWNFNVDPITYDITGIEKVDPKAPPIVSIRTETPSPVEVSPTQPDLQPEQPRAEASLYTAGQTVAYHNQTTGQYENYTVVNDPNAAPGSISLEGSKMGKNGRMVKFRFAIGQETAKERIITSEVKQYSTFAVEKLGETQDRIKFTNVDGGIQNSLLHYLMEHRGLNRPAALLELKKAVSKARNIPDAKSTDTKPLVYKILPDLINVGDSMIINTDASIDDSIEIVSIDKKYPKQQKLPKTE